MRNLIPILLAVVVLSSGCDPDGYSCNSEGCYAENNAQYLTLEDCLSVCDEQIPGGCGSPVLHEGYAYSTVQIGDQCWFSENCRYLPEVSPSSEGSETIPHYYVANYEGTDVEAAMSTANYETYGVLYNQPAVMTEGICPSGWHIPSDGEWKTMELSLGMSESEASNYGWRGTDQGLQMKSTSGWNADGNGSNSSGFNGSPGGWRTSGGFDYVGSFGDWWSASETILRVLSDSHGGVYRMGEDQNSGFSARCVRD